MAHWGLEFKSSKPGPDPVRSQPTTSSVMNQKQSTGKTHINRLFPSCFEPHYESEAFVYTFYHKN